MASFGGPALSLQGLPTSPLFWGGAALVLSYSAYVAEVFRAGIDSIPKGQIEAARMVGLSGWQITRRIKLPHKQSKLFDQLMRSDWILAPVRDLIGAGDIPRDELRGACEAHRVRDVLRAGGRLRAAKWQHAGKHDDEEHC